MNFTETRTLTTFQRGEHGHIVVTMHRALGPGQRWYVRAVYNVSAAPEWPGFSMELEANTGPRQNRSDAEVIAADLVAKLERRAVVARGGA